MDYNLKGKTVIVTGGAQGLGKAICLNFAAEGVNVAINYRSSADKALKLAEEIHRIYGVKSLAIQGDVTNEADVARMFNEVEAYFDTIDVLVNNSGVCPVTLVKDMSYEEWKTVIDINLNGVFLTSREMVNRLIATGKKGKIVNVASQAAYNGSKRGKSHYSASKGGVVSFTNSLAKEVAPYGIRVNAVAPGMMYTEMTAATLDAEMDKYNASIPIGRIAEVDEVAKVILFLASDTSSYITGATIDVSGGITGR